MTFVYGQGTYGQRVKTALAHPYTLGRSRGPRITRRFSPAARRAPVTRQAGPFRVQGQKASNLEFRVYQALRRLGWGDAEIEFQADVLGGRMPGGQVLDFVVRTFGQTIVIAVDGDYWHNRTLQQIQQDKEKSAAITAAWRRPFKFLKLNTGDLLTDEQAERILLREVGRGG